MNYHHSLYTLSGTLMGWLLHLVTGKKVILNPREAMTQESDGPRMVALCFCTD